MKKHVLRAIVLVLVFLSYFAWRINMIGPNPILIPFVLAAVVALAVIIWKFCREPKDENQRKQDRAIFIMILVLFLVAVLVRILFLS